MLYDRCVQGGILEGKFTGRMEDDAYNAPAPGVGLLSDGPQTCIVLLTDIFGLPLKNCKIIADSLAKELGVDVWVPDQFAGKPIVKSSEMNGLSAGTPGEKRGFFGTLKMVLLFLFKIHLIIRNRPSVTDARVTKFVKNLRSNKGYKKIGAVGFCWGGGSIARLASTNLFDSVVVFHPAPISLKEIQAIKIPISFGCAEEDSEFPLKRAREYEATLTEKKKNGGSDFEFVEYMGVCRGFACRPAENNPVHKERFMEAFNQTKTWFVKTLKESV